MRVTLQALAAVLGGTQCLHTNSKDEALALPSEAAVEVALRTQQVIAYESGVADTVDPLAGSYYVEQLTDEIERRALAVHRAHRRDGRRGQGDRGGLHPERNPGRRLRGVTCGRERGAGGSRA